MRPHMMPTRTSLVCAATPTHGNHLHLTDCASALLQVPDMCMALLLSVPVALEDVGPGSFDMQCSALYQAAVVRGTETGCISTLPVLFGASAIMSHAQFQHAAEGAEMAPAACRAVQGMYQRPGCAYVQPCERRWYMSNMCAHTLRSANFEFTILCVMCIAIGVTSGNWYASSTRFMWICWKKSCSFHPVII